MNTYYLLGISIGFIIIALVKYISNQFNNDLEKIKNK